MAYRFTEIVRHLAGLQRVSSLKAPRLLTSLPFARQADIVASSANVRWTVVIARYRPLARRSMLVKGIHNSMSGRHHWSALQEMSMNAQGVLMFVRETYLEEQKGITSGTVADRYRQACTEFPAIARPTILRACSKPSGVQQGNHNRVFL
jgi:hypothetical protein